MIAILLHNPALLVCLLLLFAGLLVLMAGLLAGGKVGAGRGWIVVGGLVTGVALLQLAGHLAVAERPPTDADRGEPAAASTEAGESRAAERIDAALAAAGLAAPLPLLDEAGFRALAEGAGPWREIGADWAAAHPSAPAPRYGRSLVLSPDSRLDVLQFVTADAAAAALETYLRAHSVMPYRDRHGIELRGVLPETGQHLGLRRSGSVLLILTAPDADALDARIVRLPRAPSPEAIATVPAPDGVSAEPLIPALQPLVHFFELNGWWQLAGVLLAVAAYTWAFFAGVGWATRVAPEAGVAAVWASELRKRLLSVNRTDAPIRIEALADGRLSVGWRLDDLTGRAFAGQAEHRRIHRLLLRLDAARERVVVTEQWAVLSRNAGADDAGLHWRMAMGVTLGQVNHRREYALRFGPDGRARLDATQTWHYSLDELKAPLIAAVTTAGWTWQPALLDVGAMAPSRSAGVARAAERNRLP